MLLVLLSVTICSGYNNLLEEETRSLIPLSCYREALDTVDRSGAEKVSMEALKKLAADLHHNPDPAELAPTKSEIAG